MTRQCRRMGPRLTAIQQRLAVPKANAHRNEEPRPITLPSAFGEPYAYADGAIIRDGERQPVRAS